MVHGVGISSVHDVSILNGVPLSLEEVVMDFISLEVRFNLFPVRLVGVHVNSHQDFVGERLKRPPYQGLEHLAGNVNLGEITVALLVRIAVVGGHQVDQPRLHHDPCREPSVKRPAKDNL